MPVRSLTGHFKWVTCPALLQRWQADYRRLQLPESKDFSIPNTIAEGETLVDETHLKTDLFLEEFRFETKPEPKVRNIIYALSKLMGKNRNEIVPSLVKQLTIVSDDIFAHLSRYATPVNAHIAINNETKTVKPGALWYEETLPPDTLLYTTLVANKSRKQGSKKEAKNILAHILHDLFPEKHPYLQLGGNETVGMGWCRVNPLSGGEK
ncbi:Protein of unknown function DUF324 [Beggiatoa sp. PS]|nr:Protein of unknown function DUF324 [Beggiatoa sp. PS]